ncbi:hypothetical protein NVP1031O_004 [Vibrio phage 1.031.O._10N.261.46.F8]|nr:hypothetical protein NVP1031O_004 [Vibrio phage 1.031.O._10N.261.46.F8]
MGRPKKDRRYVYDTCDEKKRSKLYVKSCGIKSLKLDDILAQYDVDPYTIEPITQ